jgi:hypothetical protein
MEYFVWTDEVAGLSILLQIAQCKMIHSLDSWPTSSPISIFSIFIAWLQKEMSRWNFLHAHYPHFFPNGFMLYGSRSIDSFCWIIWTSINQIVPFVHWHHLRIKQPPILGILSTFFHSKFSSTKLGRVGLKLGSERLLVSFSLQSVPLCYSTYYMPR